MKAVKLKEGIYWVGSIDWDLRNFHGYLTQRGSTYNAYLLIDEKITLIDTVKHYCYDEMMERISSVIDPLKINYVISNHVEMDHSGSLIKLTELLPQATVITSPNGKKGLLRHFKKDLNWKEVKSGEELSIGRWNLLFQLMPMVHWPDSMATYLKEEKILFPNDAFGQHVSSYERFDDEVISEIILEEAKKYYANIVLPFGSQVQKALAVLSQLEIEMIAPSHGIIWRSHIAEILAKYVKWSNNETAEKALVIYDTMWESTEKIALAIYKAFEDSDIKAKMVNLQHSHISDVMTELIDTKYICVGSPTLNNNMLPTVAAFLTYMKGLAPKQDRVGLAFGSYGWGGQSIAQVEDFLKECGFALPLESIKVNYIPDEQELLDITNKVKAVLK